MPVLVGEGEEHLEDEELQREQRCKFIARAWFGHQNESSVKFDTSFSPLQTLRHEDRVGSCRSDRVSRVHNEAAPLIEPDRIRRHIRRQSCAALVLCKLLHEREQHTTMAKPLEVRTNRHPATDRGVAGDVDSHDPDRLTAMKQELWMIAGGPFIRTVFLVNTELPARLEQHLPTDIVIRAPRGLAGWREQLVVLHSFRFRPGDSAQAD